MRTTPQFFRRIPHFLHAAIPHRGACHPRKLFASSQLGHGRCRIRALARRLKHSMASMDVQNQTVSIITLNT
jgi:hypothetical protein